jgi:hypothetical protein
MAVNMRFLHNNSAFAITPTLAVGASDTGFSLDSITDEERQVYWRGTAAIQEIVIDLGTPVNINGVAVLRHNLGDVDAGASHQIWASTDNFVVSNDLIATLSISTNDDWYADFTGSTYRYWKLKINWAATDPKPEVGQFAIFESEQTLSSNPDYGFRIKRIIPNRKAEAEDGDLVVATTGREVLEFSMRFRDRDMNLEYNQFLTMLAHILGGTRPFIFVREQSSGAIPTQGRGYWCRWADPWDEEFVYHEVFSWTFRFKEIQ